ncbi:PTS transporter subunit EIIB [Erysipelothrix sp. D19-032]
MAHVDNCITRLRIDVVDTQLINNDILKESEQPVFSFLQKTIYTLYLVH